MLKIYNTLNACKEIFEPINDNNVNMYVCGVTVYDKCHVGHARSAVVFDTARRYMKYRGYKVTFVKNFTDIDDKIINKSKETGISWKEITEKYIREHDYDMNKLNVKKPDYEPKATDYIDDMIELCSKLIEKGNAYEIDGDVYFRVKSFQEYGKLSNRDIEELKAGTRIELRDNKEDPLDFALWKKSKEGEPGWESPWGKGRPGWHIECSVMSSKILGLPFDIHGGGKDLIFPHHENEIAQSEASCGCQFAKYWMHNGFVNINKEKMSKSLGNFFTIRDIIEEFEPESLRYFLLTTHYRSPLDFSEDKLIEAESALDRIYTLIDSMVTYKAGRKGKNLLDEVNSIKEHFEKDFIEAMDDDFNTAAALSVIFEYIRKMNVLLENKPDKESFKSLKNQFNDILEIVRSTLGIAAKTPEDWFRANLSIPEKELFEKINQRNEYRKNKEFDKADKIRDELEKKGVELLDTPEGTKYRARRVH
ncbi:cysteinyl-tRNA synthetase [Flexistipes sinusarabici DSM 4947]|uniref:Cysteine--tRNA ligase n=1 Tax=Flexistipes sinusarabici (strain ATCC 49648 / DSM 4947 / MAS 10) TaxID=717231 RepID=F8E878_FLESM|nr:cysteine--tRNA ligase [Flexistipes sinusarabici]AEI15075.1 cysteinyl-tRNA synthetase [Flexistipes sinusarabici DSM 4947]